VFSRFRLLNKRPPEPSTGGRQIYAIGDVHGRADLLRDLLETVRADADARRGDQPPLIIFLGDYVDRGADSAGVVEQILELKRDARFQVRALKGNHEQALLRFLDEATFGPVWAQHGGVATLQSYGVEPPENTLDPDAWEPARARLEALVPSSHRLFYCGLELAIVLGDFAFVHAGVRPGVPLERQSETDLLWIRGEFLRAPGPFGKIIVHGHTPRREVQITKHRMGIDTGAYYSGILTALRLDGSEPFVLQARDETADAEAAEPAEVAAPV